MSFLIDVKSVKNWKVKLLDKCATSAAFIVELTELFTPT